MSDLKHIECPQCEGKGCRFCKGSGRYQLKSIYELALRKMSLKDPNLIDRLQDEVEELREELRIFKLNRSPEALDLLRGEIEDVLFWMTCIELKEFSEGAYVEGINRKGLLRFPEEM